MPARTPITRVPEKSVKEINAQMTINANSKYAIRTFIATLREMTDGMNGLKRAKIFI